MTQRHHLNLCCLRAWTLEVPEWEGLGVIPAYSIQLAGSSSLGLLSLQSLCLGPQD